MDIAHPASSTALAINAQSSIGTNFSSGATASLGVASASSAVMGNTHKKNNYLNQLQNEIGNLYNPVN